MIAVALRLRTRFVVRACMAPAMALGAALTAAQAADPVQPAWARPAWAQPAWAQPVWPDTFLARLEATAVLRTLDADLLGHASSALVLGQWCKNHRVQPQDHLEVHRSPQRHKQLPPELRDQLAVHDRDEIIYRRSTLTCGPMLLGEFENWYAPGRLTPQMNQQLLQTNAPFGQVVQHFGYRREILSNRLLWSPLPQDWEHQSPKDRPGGSMAVPQQLLEHRSVLVTRDHLPFSVMVEIFDAALLGAPPAFIPPSQGR